MGIAATKRTRVPRDRAKETTNAPATQWEGRPGFYKADMSTGDMLSKLRHRFKVRSRFTPEPGVRAARKAALLAKRREAKARARANGKRG